MLDEACVAVRFVKGEPTTGEVVLSGALDSGARFTIVAGPPAEGATYCANACRSWVAGETQLRYPDMSREEVDRILDAAVASR